MNVWVEAARPRTLPASLAPVLVGTAAGAAGHRIDAGRFALVVVVALAVQIAVNYANDYFDGVRGVDTVQRAGPRRAVASGLVTPRAMLVAIGLAMAVAGAAGLERLHVVAIDNASATYGWRGGLASRFTAEGWSAVTVDGRDHDALYEAFTAPHPGRPHAVVARVEPKYA